MNPAICVGLVTYSSVRPRRRSRLRAVEQSGSAVERLDAFLALGPPRVTVLMPDLEELAMSSGTGERSSD
jgi:hypothetical protein